MWRCIVESTARVAIAVAIGFSLLVLLCGGSVEALRPSLSSLPTSTTLTKQSFEEKPPSLPVEEDQKVHESVEIFNLVAAEEQKAVPAEGVHNTNIRVQNIEDPGSLGQKDGNSKQWKTCGVVALFNPAGYSSRLDNFRRFRTASRAQNLWLMVVHLVLSDEHEHGNEEDKDVCMENEIISVPEDADALISLRADSGATLWQKERLINVGIDHLPEDCKAVVWPDAELLFTEIDWVEQTLNLVLEGEMVLQPYQYAIRLSQGQLWLDPRRARKSLDKNEGVRTPGFAFAVESSPPSRKSRILDSQKDHGYTGFAWAASRDALREMGGLFDLAVVGGADALMAHAFEGHFVHEEDLHRKTPVKIPYYYAQRLISPDSPLAHRFQDWAERAFKVSRGKLAYVSGSVLHLWHGTKEARQYSSRFKILHPNISDRKGVGVENYVYNPDEHLERMPCHSLPTTTVDLKACYIWRWRDTNPVAGLMLSKVQEMFRQRAEDGE